MSCYFSTRVFFPFAIFITLHTGVKNVVCLLVLSSLYSLVCIDILFLSIHIDRWFTVCKVREERRERERKAEEETERGEEEKKSYTHTCNIHRFIQKDELCTTDHLSHTYFYSIARKESSLIYSSFIELIRMKQATNMCIEHAFNRN